MKIFKGAYLWRVFFHQKSVMKFLVPVFWSLFSQFTYSLFIVKDQSYPETNISINTLILRDHGRGQTSCKVCLFQKKGFVFKEL